MKSLIGDNWCDAKDGSIIEVRNPATNELIDAVPSLSEEEVEEAIEYAYVAQKEWKKIPLHERCSILMKFVNLVERDKANLAKTLSDETGKPIREAYSEIGNISIDIPSYVGRVQHDYGNLIPRGTEKGQENTIQYTIQEPLGVCAAIMSDIFSNDEFINKVTPALLMGNSVILKPSSISPLTLTKYVELLIESGIPTGVISIIHGDDSILDKKLTTNKKVSFVTLPHSNEIKSGIFILCEDGDIELAVEETILERLYNAGQTFNASKRFLIQNSVKDEYITKLISKIKTLKVGYPSEEETDIGCLISEKNAIEVENRVNKLIEQGARLIYGGRRNGAFYEPTILDGISNDMEMSTNLEISGPVILITDFNTLEEAIEIANHSKATRYASIITKNINKAINTSEQIECSSFVINGSSHFKYSKSKDDILKEISQTKTIILKNITK